VGSNAAPSGPWPTSVLATTVHHDSRHTMGGRRFQCVIPRRLPVVVSVDVDKSRRDRSHALCHAIAGRVAIDSELRALTRLDKSVGVRNRYVLTII
jgi:hypothetical protein